MEHDTYGDEAACIIVDERGKLVLDDVYNGFDDDTLRLLDLEVKEVPEMPDPALSVQDMKDYGYAWAGVLPAGQEAAEKAMEKGCAVYRLYSDNTEGLCVDAKEIADHAAQNLVIARLHSNGVLNSSEYSEQVSAIENKIEKLQVERKRLLACDETNELLRMIKMLNDILSDYNPTEYFDTELFEQIIQSITVESSTELTFHLIGGIDLTECIPGKGRRKTV